MIKEIFKKMTFLPAIMVMIVIAGFSNKTADDSSSLSLRVTEKTVDIVQECGIGSDWSNNYYTEVVEKLHTPIRKVAHMTEYMILSICMVSALYINGLFDKTLKITNQIICSLYAVSDEIHQIFVKDRACRFLDVCIDSVGAFIGMIIVLFVIGEIQKNQQRLTKIKV